MRLFVVRHGNTFGADQAGGERIFMAGCHQNIPLVATGRMQARRMAKTLHRLAITPTAIYANHLLRTWEFACIINEYFYHHTNVSIPIKQDDSLLEFDYGAWAGLTTSGQDAAHNQVIARFGKQAWDDWQLRRIIPQGGPHHWQVTESSVIAGIQTFLQHLVTDYAPDDTVIAVGSQGTLSFMNALLPGGMARAIDEQRYRIKTGHYCEFEYCEGEWILHQWNQAPE